MLTLRTREILCSPISHPTEWENVDRSTNHRDAETELGTKRGRQDENEISQGK